MKKQFKETTIISLLIVVLLLMQVVPTFASEDVDVISQSAILMDATTGEVLYSKSADEERTPASLTKMMTAILVMDNLDMGKMVTVPDKAVGIYGNNMALQHGEKLSVEELLNAMLIYSANDAAITLAIEVAGSESKFYSMMNQRAKKIGCKNTNFISENGLTNDSKHHSTARDMALITKEAMTYKEIQSIVKKTEYTIAATNKSGERNYKSTNKLLYDTKDKFTIDGKKVPIKYDYAIGVKTGYMSSSGYCLAAEAQKDDTKMIAVVLGGNEDLDRFIDGKMLLSYGLDNYNTVEPVKAGEVVDKIRVKWGAKRTANVTVKDSLYATLPVDADLEVLEKNIKIDDNIDAPAKKGTEVGSIDITEAGIVIGSAKLYIAETVEKGGPWSILGISDIMFYTGVGIIVLLILLFFIHKRRKRLRKIRKEERLKIAREKKALEIARERAEKKRREWPY